MLLSFLSSRSFRHVRKTSACPPFCAQYRGSAVSFCERLFSFPRHCLPPPLLPISSPWWLFLFEHLSRDTFILFRHFLFYGFHVPRAPLRGLREGFWGFLSPPPPRDPPRGFDFRPTVGRFLVWLFFLKIRPFEYPKGFFSFTLQSGPRFFYDDSLGLPPSSGGRKHLFCVSWSRF